ncbi:M48 family metallopeptidase [Olsenella uli]|uniref:M48 family metallopeptidase n=1 Tax=Olsenella uli TaxID=133926 RepID=UPI0012AB9950|nr:SprT family zinc-dependent metalloprotease [Olsenella uli]
MATSFTAYVTNGDGSERPIPVLVTRKRVRNLNLRVRRDGSVTLSIPWHTSRERAEAFLAERAAWVRAALERQARRTEAANRDHDAESDTYPLWGVTQMAGAPLPPEEVAGIYRSEVARTLPEAVGRMEALIGAQASDWQLRDMRTRWGSCTPRTGRIRINIRLAAYPPECLDYVVAHELAHLLEPSHNARFHAIVARAVPNEWEIRARLRQPPVWPVCAPL